LAGKMADCFLPAKTSRLESAFICIHLRLLFLPAVIVNLPMRTCTLSKNTCSQQKKQQLWPELGYNSAALPVMVKRFNRLDWYRQKNKFQNLE